MPVPCQVDVVCGTSSESAHFKLEFMASVNPQDFVRAVYDAVQAVLAASPQTAPTRGGETGSVPVGPVPASRSRGAGANPAKVAKFDADAARARAAAAC